MKSKTLQRRYKRVSPPHKATMNFKYRFETDLDVSSLNNQERKDPLEYSAVLKDLSAEGICFYSRRKLKKGEKLNLECHIPGGDKSVFMEGQVRWSKAILTGEKGRGGYDTGVKLTTIDDHSVHDSIYFDEAYHVYWSDVLESIVGQFRVIQQKRYNSPHLTARQ